MKLRLINKAGQVVEVGQDVVSFRGERATIKGIHPPEGGDAADRVGSGRVITNLGSHYPSVYNLVWAELSCPTGPLSVGQMVAFQRTIDAVVYRVFQLKDGKALLQEAALPKFGASHPWFWEALGSFEALTPEQAARHINGPAKAFTVILLYPDFIAEDYGQETILHHVAAHSAEEAIETAKANHGEDADSFFPLAVFAGHLQDLNP